MEADLPQARSPLPCARMKDGVILRVSKPARMGIDDSGRKALRPPIQHKLFAPQAQSCSGPSPKLRLLDHLVSASEQHRRHRETEPLCRVEIDSEIKFGWNLDRQLGGRGTAQNAVHVTR